MDHAAMLRAVVSRPHAYPPNRFAGRGIVICAGGRKYFTCAFVTLRALRRTGCRLPIELWHLGPGELSPPMASLLEPLDVRIIDALAVRRSYPVRLLAGWELKPYAVIHSSFEEVLLLDADNVPARDPSYLFDSPAFARTGAVFWPDRWRRPGDPHQLLRPSAWDACGLPFQPGPECESGQLLVDKRRSWRSLQVAMHLNEHSDHYYRHFYGDKDTYRLAWLLCGQPYAMPDTPVESTPGGEILFQHDFDGRVVFQHRSVKWQLLGPNFRHARFAGEDACLADLDELRRRWDGHLRPASARAPDERAAYERIVAQRNFEYERVGFDRRPMELLGDGTIGHGAARLERTWDVEIAGGRVRLVLQGDAGVICALEERAPDRWGGRWTQFERMPIVVLAARTAARPSTAAGAPLQSAGLEDLRARLLRQRFFEYVRVGYDRRIMELCHGGAIGAGRARLETTWKLDGDESRPSLLIEGEAGLICLLEPATGGAWQGRWTQFGQMPIVLAPRPERARRPFAS